MDQTQVIGGMALAVQLGTAAYALRLNRIFGTDRAGWSLFGAFALMLAVHLSEAWFSGSTSTKGDTTSQLVYLMSSSLLLIGLAHVGMLFQERLRTEQVIRASRDQLEHRVRERTLELAQTNTLLQAEVSERRRAEAEIKASQNRYQELVNSLDCVVFEAEGPDLHFTFVSPQCEPLLGYPPDQLLGRLAWRDFVHPEDVQMVFDACGRNVAAHGKSTLEFRALANDGREVWLRQLSTVSGENERVVKLRGVLLDITERRKMELQLRDAQRLESIGRLAGGVAHDFNNILTVIQGHADCLLTLDHLPSPILDSLRSIRTAGERAAQLTSQLLAFGQARAPEMEVVDLNRVIGDALPMLRRILGEDIAVEPQLSSGPIGVLADAGLIEQVLMNLTINAREAMPYGGHLDIQTRLLTVTQDYTADGQQFPAGEYACLTMSDTGCGIPPEDLPRIFEPFFTTKQMGKGPGLGLATAYGVIRQHRGWISVTSTLGTGTTFHVHVPLSLERLPTPPPLPTSPTTASTPVGTETLLVVEDETAVRTLVCNILRRLGYRVLEAESGVGALNIWQHQRDSVDLLLTDIIMPGGINGWELAEKLTAENPALKVLCTSGHTPETLRVDMRHRLLPKPYDVTELAQAVRETLDQATLEPQLSR